MPAAWTIEDSEGQLLADFIAGSRRDVGRKIVPTRYDAFRLQVSGSYREVFDRDLEKVLEERSWRIVPVRQRATIRNRTRGYPLRQNLQ